MLSVVCCFALAFYNQKGKGSPSVTMSLSKSKGLINI
jgi:hypothetical protein